MRTIAAILLFCACLGAQTTTVAGPTYFSTTGVRASYYDQTLTETTNIGMRVTSAGNSSAPKGVWAVLSVDATPRSQASTAALRIGARYFLNSTAGGNVILYANAQGGAVTTPTASTNLAPASSMLGNIQGGMGAVWRVCHTFNSNSKVNCIADLDFELNSVTSQSVKPLVGLYVGLTF